MVDEVKGEQRNCMCLIDCAKLAELLSIYERIVRSNSTRLKVQEHVPTFKVIRENEGQLREQKIFFRVKTL